MFQELKERFIKELVLAAPVLDKKMRMKVNASDYTTGKILLMKYENRRWRPIVYLSKSLNEIERNYEIHDKKILVNYKRIGKLEIFIRGCQVQV